MDMNGSAAIPTRVDSEKLNRSFLIGNLITAQIFLSAFIDRADLKIGIVSRHIAVPDIDECTRQWRAIVALDMSDIDLQFQRQSGLDAIIRWIAADIRT